MMAEPALFSHIEHSDTFPVLDTKWIPGTVKFLVLGGTRSGTGVIKIYELNGGRLGLVGSINGKSTVKTCTFLPAKRHQHCFAVGDFDGTLQILNVERSDAFLYKEEMAHAGVINDVDAVGGDGTGAVEVVSAGSDGCVRVWDPRQKQFPVARFEPKTDNAYSVRYPCTAARFGNAFDSTERCVGAGYDNGDLILFDLRSMKIRWQTHINSSVCSLEFDDKSSPLNRLTVGTSAGRVHAFNIAAESSEIITDASLSDKVGEPIWCVRHLPQHPKTIAATGNAAIHLLNLSEETTMHSPRKFEIGNYPINCFEWNAERAGLAVCGSFNQQINVILAVNLGDASTPSKC